MSGELIGVIGGSGLGDAIAGELEGVVYKEVETPFGSCSGPVAVGRLGDSEVAFLNRHGAGHRYNPSSVPYAANIFALKQLGVRSVIASGAVGSLREEIGPSDLVLIDQFIDKTFCRERSFFDNLGAVHVEFSRPVCGRLRGLVMDCAKELDFNVHDGGTYVCMEGPMFSTRAESLMHRQWGGDVIGMTAMPEARLAREAQMCYCLVALASDYDSWKEGEAVGDKETLLKEIIGNLESATSNAVGVIKHSLTNRGASMCEGDCGCRGSLELAVWTAEDAIDSAEREKLGVLFE